VWAGQTAGGVREILKVALPLFGTGLGLVGLLARRRKQKVAVVLPA
jgi:hypothetical protein